MPVSISLEIVTPTQAKEWVATIEKERDFRVYHAETILRAMQEGTFYGDRTGEPIKFNDKGNLIDGQHRLWAVAAFGKPVRLWVARGLPDTVMPVLDTGARRTPKDYFKLSGETHYTHLAAVANLIFNATDDRQLYMTKSNKPSTSELMMVLEKYPKVRESVAAIVNRGTDRYKKGKPILALTNAAALHFLFSKAESKERAEEFFARLEDGANLSERSPILVLRNMLIANRTAPKKYERGTILALTILAWNAWIAKKPVTQLKYRVTDSFPAITGLPKMSLGVLTRRPEARAARTSLDKAADRTAAAAV